MTLNTIQDLGKHLLSSQRIRGFFNRPQPREFTPLPGLYAKLNSNNQLSFLYYWPKKNSINVHNNHSYEVFCHHLLYNQPRIINMVTPSLSPSQPYSSKPESYDLDDFLPYNFYQLNQSTLLPSYHGIACEIHTRCVSFSDSPPIPISDLIDTLNLWGIPNYLYPTSTPSWPNHLCQPKNRWQNYTWMLFSQDTPQMGDICYAQSILSYAHPQLADKDAIFDIIPLVHDKKCIEDYHALFQTTKTYGNVLYRGLDHLSSSYIQWILSDDPCSYNQLLDIYSEKPSSAEYNDEQQYAYGSTMVNLHLFSHTFTCAKTSLSNYSHRL